MAQLEGTTSMTGMIKNKSDKGGERDIMAYRLTKICLYNPR